METKPIYIQNNGTKKKQNKVAKKKEDNVQKRYEINQRISKEYSLILNTLPQDGAYKSNAPNLLQMYLILGPLRDLVNTSTSWSLELTKLVVIHPDAIFSFMK